MSYIHRAKDRDMQNFTSCAHAHDFAVTQPPLGRESGSRRAALILLTLSFLAMNAMAADPCDPVHAGFNKMFHASPKQKVTNSGAVNVTNAFGEITEGDWKETCAYLRDESLDGKPASVYSDRMSSEKGSADGLVWISKATGAILRQDVDADMGAKGKGHQSIRFDYGNK